MRVRDFTSIYGRVSEVKFVYPSLTIEKKQQQRNTGFCSRRDNTTEENWFKIAFIRKEGRNERGRARNRLT